MSISRHRTTVVYRLHIQLRGISPPIWRRLLIPVNSTILNLHEVIQAAMGWEDIHLNRFMIRGQLYEVLRDRGMSFSTRPDRIQLIDFGFCEHDRFVYEYDFYSRRIHDIRIWYRRENRPARWFQPGALKGLAFGKVKVELATH